VKQRQQRVFGNFIDDHIFCLQWLKRQQKIGFLRRMAVKMMKSK
jgi:hypothetical protein